MWTFTVGPPVVLVKKKIKDSEDLGLEIPRGVSRSGSGNHTLENKYS